MTAVARSAVALTVSGVVAVSAAFVAAPASVAAERAGLPVLSVNAEAIALTAFNPIADQFDILYTYGAQAVDVTATFVSNLVTPIIQGQFWPVSGYPGNYIANAFNSAANWVSGMADTATGFIQAEINYFGGFVPNVINWAANVVQNVINWITGWLPWPFAAVKAPSTRPASSVRRAAAAAAAPTADTAATQQGAPAVSQAGVAASSGTRHAAHSAPTARSAASAKNSVHATKAAAATGRNR